VGQKKTCSWLLFYIYGWNFGSVLTILDRSGKKIILLSLLAPTPRCGIQFWITYCNKRKQGLINMHLTKVCPVSILRSFFIWKTYSKCLKKAACSPDIVFNVVPCAMHLLNVVLLKLQVPFNINFIVVERTNVYVSCHPQRSYHCRLCIIGMSRLHARSRKSLRWACYGWQCPYESNKKYLEWRWAKIKCYEWSSAYISAILFRWVDGAPQSR